MSIKSQPGNMATGASPSGNVIVQSQNLLGNEKELWTVCSILYGNIVAKK